MVKMPSDIKLYKSGVYTASACTNAGAKLYYQPLLIGYNKVSSSRQKNDLPYWITMWAFGPDWGEGGFMRIEKDNGGTSAGPCLIHNYPLYIVPKSI
jgi:Papain family cysteine protease